MTDLFPKPPKKMRQPRKDVLREQLALAADEIASLRRDLERERSCPYWRRVLGLGPGPLIAVWSEPFPNPPSEEGDEIVP